MKVVAVIPTYNEAQNVRILIPRILGLGPEFHVLVVDDSSPDATADVVRELQKTDPRVSIIVRPGKMGLGSAYIAGFKEALKSGADFIIEIDADHSHDYKDIPRFLEEMSSYDLVIGSRYKKGISVIDWPLSRVLLSYFGNIYARVITGLKTFDNTGGFKCFKRKVLEAIDLDAVKSNGYAFQIEMNFRAAASGFKLSEIPIIFWGRYSGVSKMSGHIVREAIFIVWRLRFVKMLSSMGLARL
ncbi:MAG: dolichyl-phosphate beta-D-mannosyltransferase [Deltaproteobacteria bacterium GWA2_55_10]|nr:MAG: dolichyl-phosphate beta-D-mannosyltransferase [Deltaproteobacteria bacterium GWA2_55_10]